MTVCNKKERKEGGKEECPNMNVSLMSFTSWEVEERVLSPTLYFGPPFYILNLSTQQDTLTKFNLEAFYVCIYVNLLIFIIRMKYVNIYPSLRGCK